MYQRAILQSCGGAPVQLMNVLDFDFLYFPLVVTVDGSPLPPSDAELVGRTPPVGQADYATAMNAFITSNVTDVGPTGEPVRFAGYFSANGGLEIFGAPTSRQVVMPGVIYQRFQRSILQYHQGRGTSEFVTEPMLLADYIKSIMLYSVEPSLTPNALLNEVSGMPPNRSRYFYQYCNYVGQPGSICNPQDLDPNGTDLTDAFEPG